MKKFSLLLILLSCFFFSNCSTTNKLVKEQSESLKSFLISNDELYVIGESHDYQFKGDDVVLLKEFLTTPFSKFINKVSVILTVINANNVNGNYTMVINPNLLTDKEINQLKSNYQFTEMPADPRYLAKTFRASGKVLILKNHDEIQKKYALKNPIQAKVSYYKTKKEISHDMGSILVIPVFATGIVLAVPFYIVNGVTKSLTRD